MTFAPALLLFRVLIGLLALLCMHRCHGQRDSTVYRVNAWVDAALIAGGVTGFVTGMKAQSAKPSLGLGELGGLRNYQVPGFDRMALRIDPAGQDRAMRISDRVMYGTLAAPGLLLLDGRVRKEWLNVYTMYVETAALTSGMQAWSCVGAGRYRPIAYIEDATLDQRIDQRNSNSFYSGHTANTAMASFFMAQVISDMHAELGGKKWWLYGAATIPPAVVGYYRIQAGKHFPTDVLTGALMGAATGVLVPILHRTNLCDGRLSVIPSVSSNSFGANLALTW